VPVARLAHDGDLEAHAPLRVDAAQPVHGGDTADR
jgi:hypothetical protein